MKLVKALFGIFCMVLLSSVAFAATDANCQKIAAGKDNSAQAKATDYRGTLSRLNPCTGEAGLAEYYRQPKYEGIWDYRYVFENGDAYGTTGMTRYVLCHDGRASIRNVFGSYYNQGNYAWGFWAYFPMKSATAPWAKEICNTL